MSTVKHSVPLRAMGPRQIPLSSASTPALEQASIDDSGLDQEQSSAHDVLSGGQSSTACAAATLPSTSEPEHAFDRIPDGGYGWIVVASCFICMFFAVGNAYAWGVIQSRLVSDQLGSASSIAFIGALYAACPAIFAILLYKCIFRFGTRAAQCTGMLLIGVSQIAAGWSGKSLAGLFLTVGLIQGVGSGLVILPVSLLSSQWFSTRRGLANGIIFSAGGIGGASIALLSAWLLERVGVDWTFRIMGIASMVFGLPASFLVRERITRRPVQFDTVLLSDYRFLKVTVASALNVFALFIAPFFLPMYGEALGLSAQAAAGLAAGYNLASAVGRIGFGFLADRLGPINSLILSIAVNSIAMLLIWPLAESVITLSFFVALSGVTSGAFFSLMPTVVTSLSEPHLLGTAMGMTVSSWAPGYLVGAPIAGYLLDASGGSNAGINPFRPGMFYAGGLAVCSSLILMQTRLKIGGLDLKRKI